MKRTAFTSAPILLSLSIGLHPLPAWSLEGTTIRVELGTDKRETEETRWQATDKTHTQTSNWALDGSTQRRDEESNSGKRIKFRDVQVNTLRRTTYTAPLEVMSRRTRTVSSKRYELQTFKEVSYVTSKPVRVQKEVGGWTIATVQVPFKTQASRSVIVQRKESNLVPIYKTIVATTSTPIAPIETTIPATRSITEWQIVPVTKYRTVTENKVVPVHYDGPMIDVSDGKTVGTCTYLGNPGGEHLHLLRFSGGNFMGSAPFLGDLVNNTMSGINYNVFYDGVNNVLQYSAWRSVAWSEDDKLYEGRGFVERVGDHHELIFDTYPSYYGPSWLGKTRVKLNGLLVSKTTETSTRTEPYTVEEGQWVTKTVDASYQVQLEHLSNAPKEKAGVKDNGVYWGHYHAPDDKCPFQILQPSSTSNGKYYFEDCPPPKPQNVFLAGKLGAWLTRDYTNSAPPQFTKVYHHTDIYPTFEYDAVLEIATSSQQVFDHSEWQWKTVDVPTTVWEDKPVFRVGGWDEASGSFTHLHGNPTMLCDNTHLPVGATAPNLGMVAHTATPLMVPYTRPGTASVWATSSIFVTEQATFSATHSALVNRVPGVEISESYSPWEETTRMRLGTGTPSTEVRTQEVILGYQDVVIPGQTPMPLSAAGGRASYLSDFGAPEHSTVSLNGRKLRSSQRSGDAIASKAKPMPAPSSLPGRDPDSDRKKLAPGNGTPGPINRHENDASLGNAKESNKRSRKH